MFIRPSTVTASVLAALAAVVAAEPVTFTNPTVEVITAVNAGPLAPGECTSYEVGAANAVLCLQEAKLTAPNNLLLVGFLFNNGTAEICDLKLAPVNAPGLTAFWPDWAGAGASYEKFFNLKQMTAVGLTSLPNKDGSMPSFEVVGMRACGPKEGKQEGKEDKVEVEGGSSLLLSRKIALADSPMLPSVVEEEAKEDEVVAATATAVPSARKLQMEEDGEEEGGEAEVIVGVKAEDLTFQRALVQGECAVYTNGTAALTLCLETVAQPSGSLSLLKGFLYNNGTKAACDVRVRAVNAPGLIELWPDWSTNSAYEMYFNPKQVTSVGMTSKPNMDGSSSSLEVTSFRPCTPAEHVAAATTPAAAVAAAATAAAATAAAAATELGAFTMKKVPIESLVLPLPEATVPAVIDHAAEQKRKLSVDIHPVDGPYFYRMEGGREGGNEDKALKAFKPGYDVTLDPNYQDGVEVPPLRDDYEICKRFDSKNDPNLEVTVCLENAKTWHDKKKGRIVSTDLSVINTGSQGICNMTVYIEGMENELEHFPQLIDDNGFDTYPKFVTWYAPGRVTNMGSAIPKAKGVPRFTVLNDLTACDEPDSNVIRRKFRCTESTRKPNAAVKICVYSDLKEWSDNDGARIVSVDGFISNTGAAPLCNLTVDISNFENARAFWGDWMPTFPYYLDEMSTLKFAANIPYEKGYPKVSLKKYAICPHKMEEPKVEVPNEEAVAANAGTTTPAAPVDPAAPGVPVIAVDPPVAPAAPAVEAPPAPVAPAAPVEGGPAVDVPAVEAPTAPVAAEGAAPAVIDAEEVVGEALTLPTPEEAAAPAAGAPPAEIANRRLRTKQ